MKIILISIVFLSALISFLFYRGRKLLKWQDKILIYISGRENSCIDRHAWFFYHSGLPDIRSPQKLLIASTDKNLIFIKRNGKYEKSLFKSWKEIVKFTTLKKDDPLNNRISIWNLFCQVLLKNKKSHYIIIKYHNHDQTEDQIILEHWNEFVRDDIVDKLDPLHEKLSRSTWKVIRDPKDNSISDEQ